MKHMKLVIGVLVILLVTGVGSVSARRPDASRIHSQGVQAPLQVIPTWQQVNSNGFGNPQVGEVTALAAFNGYLYAGTHYPVSTTPPYEGGAQIFSSQNGVTWTPVGSPGFGEPHDIRPPAVLDLVVFNNRLYASTGRGGNAGQIRRLALDGVTWTPLVVDGFNDPNNVDITALVVFGNQIYAGVTNSEDGARIYRSTYGDNNTWGQVGPETPGTAVSSITGFAVAPFDGALYAAVESEAPAQIWRSDDGSLWTTEVDDGFGDSNTTFTGGMAAFGGFLYVGAGNTASGAQLFRTNDGAIWNPVTISGLNAPNNQKVETVFVFQNQLYVSVKNTVTGLQLWRSPDGTLWERANLDGFGDSHNPGSNWSNATADFLGHLYVGTSNVTDGGELWRMQQHSVYVPLALRSP